MQPAELQQMLELAWQVLDSLDVGAGKCCCQLVIFIHSICCILAL
jgi:hypothetical protein